MPTPVPVEPDAGPLRRLDYWPPKRALAAGILAGGLAVLALPLAGVGGWPAWLVAACVPFAALWLALTARPIARPIPDAVPAGTAGPDQAEPEPVPVSPYFEPLVLDALPPELPADLALQQIPGGRFQMGSADDDSAAGDSEKPRHAVSVPTFELMAFQVSRRLYRELMGKDPGYPQGEADRRPVNNVSWQDAAGFCNALSGRLGLTPCYDEQTWTCDPTKYGLRLPSEAEWEYAARAGSTGKWCFGDEEATLKEYAVFGRPWESGPEPVGGRKPNRWGLYDMHGNVWEWVEDHWHDDYTNAPNDASGWLHDDKSGEVGRVLRGGSCLDSAAGLRSAFRDRNGASYWFRVFGFRCARSARQP